MAGYLEAGKAVADVAAFTLAAVTAVRVHADGVLAAQLAVIRTTNYTVFNAFTYMLSQKSKAPNC